MSQPFQGYPLEKTVIWSLLCCRGYWHVDLAGLHVETSAIKAVGAQNQAGMSDKDAKQEEQGASLAFTVPNTHKHAQHARHARHARHAKHTLSSLPSPSPLSIYLCRWKRYARRNERLRLLHSLGTKIDELDLLKLVQPLLRLWRIFSQLLKDPSVESWKTDQKQKINNATEVPHR